MAWADSGIPIPNGTWTYVLTHGYPAEANGWEQLVYVPPLKMSIMLSQYHQRNSEPDESLVGYHFDTNSWTVVDMGGNFHTEAIPEGGESQGFFDFDPNNNTIVYHCCTSGSNQPEDINHDWVYDVLGQSGRDHHTSPKPAAQTLLPGGVFDRAHNVLISFGGASYVGTWAYDPVANSWKQMFPGGTLPDPSLALPGLAYSTAAQKIYLFGGQSESNGSYPNDLYVYDYPSNSWSLITPANGVKPPGRTQHALAYDSTNNVFLLFGGRNASGVLNDTWIYNPVSNLWTQVTTPAPAATNTAVFAKVSYDSDHNVFVLAQIGDGGGYYGGAWNTYGITTYLFRYAGTGPNAGAEASSAAPAAGGLNHYNGGWAKDPTLVASGSSLYVGWSEASSPFSSIDDAWPHLYVSQYSGGNWIPLGGGFASISSDLFEAHAPSLALVNGAPWISYYQSANTGQTALVYSSSWNGTSWSGGSVGLDGTGSPLYQGQSQITNVGGVPYVALLETDKSVFPQRALAYVRYWTGSGWALRGSALNVNTSAGATAQSVSITSDGARPTAAWSEYLHTANQGDGYDRDSNPQIYVSQWNGSQWVRLGGALNANSSNWAADPSIACFNGTFYVAWVERSQAGNNQLYVSAWNGTSWVPVTAGALNRAPGSGWAYHPSLVADAGTNRLYAGWVEQTALGQKAQVFVSMYAGGSSWTSLGGALNADTIQGSAQRVSIGVYNGQPVAAWGEVNLGATRQVYVKEWSGSSWVMLPGPAVPDITPPSTPANVTVTIASTTQLQVSWSRSDDTVGTTGYQVYRNGTQIATVTSTLSYSDTVTQTAGKCYTVAAFDAAGNVSAQSAPVCTALAPTAVNLSATQVIGGGSVTSNTVTISAPAPAGGTVVTLSTNTAGMTVPASVTVAAGATVSGPFTITTSTVSVNTAVRISAAANGVTVSSTLNVLALVASAVTLSPTSVAGGLSTTANTVTLSGPAPAGGAVVTLSSNNAAAVPPASITVAAGTTVSAAFTIATKTVSTNTLVAISATYNGTTVTATLTVTAPLAASSMTVNLLPTSVIGGSGIMGSNNVSLASAAPSGGTVVSLASSDPSVTLPSSVTVAAGQTVSPNFVITTNPVPSNLIVTIAAKANGIMASANLTVLAPTVAVLNLAPNPVVGGAPASGNYVTLNGKAPTGGAVVTLASSNPSVTVPASVTVAAGGTVSPTFAIVTKPVTANTAVTISATYAGVTKTSTLTVVPLALSSISLSPTTVVGGTQITGQNTVTLNGPAPSGGTVVTLSSSDSSAAVPSSVTVPAGATSVGFIVTTSAVAATRTVTISASYNGVTKSANLIVTPILVSAVSLSPKSVAGGLSTTANTVTLTSSAPPGGAVVSLSSSNATATVPPSVTVPQGSAVSPSFTITTKAVVANTAVTISATYNGATVSSTLTVTAPGVAGVTLSPPSIVGGAPTTANTVALNSPAPSGGAVVTLSSNNAAARVPQSVTVGAGATVSPAFTITTSPVSTNTPVQISATYNGVTASATLTLMPPGVSAVTLSPNAVVGGNPTGNNTVSINGPAPVNGAVVTLASNNAAATVPPSVTIAAGATSSPAFTITTTAVTVNTVVTITATYSGSSATATLTVTPPAGVFVSAVSLSPSSVLGGSGTTGTNTVSLSGPAPPGGMAVALSSSDPSVTLPASVTVAGGATVSPTFSIRTTPVAANLSVTITAAANNSAKTAILTVLAPSVSVVNLAPNPIVGGASSSGNFVTLNGYAPSGGAVVTLASSNPSVTLPASVTVAAGATVSPTFTISSSSPVSANTPVTISASYGGVTRTATLTLVPIALSSLSLSPTTVIGGTQITGQNTVTLNGPAPAGGTLVALASSAPTASVPSSVTVPAGATSVTFVITTRAVTSSVAVTISATYNGVTRTANLTVTPPSVSALFLSPTSVAGGGSTTQNKVMLNGPAPAGGVTVMLSSSSAIATVPASIVIPAGSNISAAFTITTTAVASNTTVTISAVYNGTRTAALTVTPP